MLLFFDTLYVLDLIATFGALRLGYRNVVRGEFLLAPNRFGIVVEVAVVSPLLRASPSIKYRTSLMVEVVDWATFSEGL